MMKIDTDIVLDYKKRFIISRLGEDYIQSGQEMRYQCPYCKDSGRRYDDYKLYVSIPQGYYFCFRCNASAKLDYDPLLVEGNYQDNTNTLLSNLKLVLTLDETPEVVPDLFRIPSTEPTPGTKSWDYIMSRNITPVDISTYHIRVDNLLSDYKLRGRFIIPNVVKSNLWTDMYVARSYTDSPKRYMNPSFAKSHDSVFNLFNIEDNPEYIIINEGAINSIVAGKYSVASFGKYVSSNQLKSIINKHPNKIYVSLDTDARDKAIALCSKISKLSGNNIKVYLVDLKDNKDASDLGHDNYMEIVKKSREFTDNKLESIYSFLGNYK